MKRGWDIETIDLTPAAPSEPVPDVPVGRWAKCRRAVKKHWLKALLIIGCAYFAFLIFGMLITDYYIDDDGYRRPIEVNYAYLEEREDYRALRDQLDGVCSLMADITVVDIHLSNGDYTDMEAATFYTKALNEQVDLMIPKITALELGDEQTVIQETMETLLSNDVAVYLQKMVEGLRTGNADSVQTALVWRDKAFSSFEILRTDMTNLAKRVKADYQSIEDWDLNEAVLAKDETAYLRQQN